MKIRIGMSMTVNAGNFQSVKPDVSLEDDVRPNETPEQARDRLGKLVHQMWITEYKKQRAILERVA